MSDYLTTGAAARILGLSMQTIARYFDDGRLTGHTLPSGHRRIDRESVDRIRVDAEGGQS